MNGGFAQSARVLAAVERDLQPRFDAPRSDPPLAVIALDEFARRRDALRRAVDRQGFPPGQANRVAACWLAIAFATGARPVEAQGFGCADDIAPRDQWHAELARARDAAVKKALEHPTDREAAVRSWGLCSLALHLGIAFPQPASAAA